YGQIHQRVTAQSIEHVIVKWHTRRNLRCSCAVEVELNVNIRFRGGALHGRFPARDQFSSHRDGDTPYSACTGAAYYCTRTLFVRLISSANYVPQRNQKR